MSLVRAVGHSIKQTTPKYMVCRLGHHAAPAGPLPKSEEEVYAYKIGTRQIVGFGWNGLPSYADRLDFPFPAIRFREDSPEIKALRVKEKGDWKQLSVAEKKALYRASFCQTFAEFKAPTGDWKLCVAGMLFGITLALWFAVWLRTYIYPPLPWSATEEGRKAVLKDMLILEVDPVDGLSSLWDYENKKWKSRWF